MYFCENENYIVTSKLKTRSCVTYTETTVNLLEYTVILWIVMFWYEIAVMIQVLKL